MRARKAVFMGLALLGLGAFFALRPPPAAPPILRTLLMSYPVEKVLVNMGASAGPHGAWHRQWIGTYTTALPRNRLETRLAVDLRRLGLIDRRSAGRSEWRSHDGSYRILLLAKNPNFWVPADPRATVYVQTWEPRVPPVGERIDDAWLRVTRPLWPKGRPAFYPVPVKTVPATSIEPR